MRWIRIGAARQDPRHLTVSATAPPFRPLTMEPGNEELLTLTFTLGCAYTDSSQPPVGGSQQYSEILIHYRALLFGHAETLPLPEPFGVENVPSGCTQVRLATAP